MKFRKFGKTLLMAALSAGVLFSFTSCTQSFTIGYLYITGLDTANPAGEGLISGYKIDNNTGKLTGMHGLPISSGGQNPSRALILSTGRFLYVLNQGANASNTACTVADPCSGGNISQFTIGGGGYLTYQATYYTQGINPFRMIADPTGTYIFVLEQAAPDSSSTAGSTLNSCQELFGSTTTACGDITAFFINQATGRLSLIQNAQLTSASNSLPLTFFPVPQNPIDFVMNSSVVLTLAYPTGASGDVYFPYTFSSGQLTEDTYSVGTNVLTNGEGNPMQFATNILQTGTFVYVLDNEPLSVTIDGSTTTSPSQVLPYTVVSGGSMTSLVGGAVADDPTVSDPAYLLLEQRQGKYVFVINDAAGPSLSDPNSGIVTYNIDPSSHLLTENCGGGNTCVTGTGSEPRCIVEDPSNQYIYTANYGDSTVNGHILDPNTGTLGLLRGSKTASSYPLSGPATWCVVTGRVH